MWRIRRFIESIQTTLTWLPIIWNDRQWDNYYTERILLKKITLMRDYHQKRQFYVGWENEVKWMTRCIELLTMLTEDRYWEDEYDDLIPTRRGLSDHMSQYTEYVDFKYTDEYKGSHADLWEDKARTLFWKIFVWRYERWWD